MMVPDPKVAMFNLAVPRDWHTRLKVAAVYAGITMKDFVMYAVEEKIEREGLEIEKVGGTE